jgi:hypothetical protein
MSALSHQRAAHGGARRQDRAAPRTTGEVRRPLGRDLSGPELEEFAKELAAHRHLWSGLVAHEPSRRVYEELLSDEHVTAWLICWMHDHDTGFHDHDVSAGAVAVVAGAVREERLRLGGPPAERISRAGGSFHFAPTDIHRVRHLGDAPAVTVHVYSPPLLRMGAYAIGEDGVLARHTFSHREELRELAVTA